ncbi:hypothetical protein V0288_18385 [Pannus brasiliensis CCIBt3594]|uniref:Uncharacterized protein n=1 Tax=Pannus brasiliensis CCIBt3594 TaxID=1427578 RepID=A0AAW9QQB5_9CHRO
MLVICPPDRTLKKTRESFDRPNPTGKTGQRPAIFFILVIAGGQRRQEAGVGSYTALILVG